MASEKEFGLVGELRMWKYDRDGNLLESRQGTNKILNKGFSMVCRMIGAYDTTTGKKSFRWVAVGKNSAVATATQTALISHTGRKKGTWTHGSTKYFSNVITFNGGSLGAPTTIYESGLFNTTTGGSGLNRKKFTGVQMATTDKLTVQWKITFTQA